MSILLDRLGITAEELQARIAKLTDSQLDEFLVLAEELEEEYRYDWELHARANQMPPQGRWLIWLILAGRGFGKTRTGTETVKKWALETPNQFIALVGATRDDVRYTMVEGESGLLACLKESDLRGGNRDKAWNRNPCELYLANGTRFKGFSSQVPESLRGHNFHYGWIDEVATLYDASKGIEEPSTTMSNLLLALRSGKNPQLVITGTPRPRRVLIGEGRKGDDDYKPGLLDREDVVVTKGTTYDNLDNLAPTFKDQILSMYEGTRTGRQELMAEILTDVEGALWSSELIERHRNTVNEWHGLNLARIVVGVDPSLTGGVNSDECGIVVVGKTFDDHYYVLADRSFKATPATWAKRVAKIYEDYRANYIVVEKTGGDMLRETMAAVDAGLPIHYVPAKDGKRLRAESVVALYEQGRVHHMGRFQHSFDALGRLEEQMTTWVPDESADSPDRIDALGYAILELSGRGYRSEQTKNKDRRHRPR